MDKQKFSPEEIITKMINRAFLVVDLPTTNNIRTQEILKDLYIANHMSSLAEATKKKISKDLKEMHATVLADNVGQAKFELETCLPFRLDAKVSNPRSSFDKDMFIKAIIKEIQDADSLEVLQALVTHGYAQGLVKTCVKTSAPPVSFTVEVIS